MTPFIKIIAQRIRIVTPQGTSLLGGLAIWGSFLAISLIGLYSLKEVLQVQGAVSLDIIGIFISATIMMAFGIIDDWKELSVFFKFLVQATAAALLILFGIRTHIVYIGIFLNMLITFFWVMGITNAFNHLDILDGLAALITGFCAISLFVVALYSGNYTMGILSLALAGSSLAFLKYNLPPARIYMGNSGSHFLGFVLAAIAINLSYAPMERKIALLSPIVVLGFPIFDTIFLILVRLLKGKSPFQKSNDHLALRLIAKGYSKQEVLLLLSLFSVIFCIFGLVLSRASNLLGVALLLFLLFICIIIAKNSSKASI